MKKFSILSFLLILSTSNIFSQSGWYPVTSNFPNYTRCFDFVDDSTGFIACNEGAILKTTNSGSNWINVYTSGNFIFYDVEFINKDTGYFCGFGTEILITTNGGNSFTVVNTQVSENIKIIFRNKTTGYAVSYSSRGKIIKTTNSGYNWQSIYTDYHGSISHITDMDIIDDTTFFVTVNYSTSQNSSCVLIKSTNACQSFIDVFNTDNTFKNVNFINSVTGYLSNTYLWRTYDSGNSWYSGAFGIISGVSIINYNNGMLFAGSPDTYFRIPTIYFSYDNGYNWYTAFIDSSHVGGIKDIDFTSLNTGYALGGNIGTNGVLLKTTNGGVPVGLNLFSSQIPLSFSLHQNYPNPFNPVTKIKFAIPNKVGNGRDRTVKIIIYDLLGREVTTLVNEQLAPGAYSVDWDGSAFASGVYFYSLIVDDPSTGSGLGFVETKRMVLLK